MRIESYKEKRVSEFAKPNSLFSILHSQLSTLNSQLVLILTLCSLVFANQVSVALKSHAMIEPGIVRLGQIAEIKGDKEFAEKIADLEVGKVSEPGRKTRISESVVKSFFIKSIANSKNIVFNGAKFCDVTARSGSVSSDSLKSLLLNEVRKRMGANLQEGKDWKFEAAKMPGSLATPERGGKIVASLSPQFSGIGQEMAVIQIFDGSKMISKHNVPFIVRRFEFAAELVNSVRKGEMVGKQDFEMVWQETTFQKRKIINKAEEAEGRTALRALRAGELLVDNSLEMPYAVKEGDVVKLFAKFGESVVQISAIAQKNAFKGQTISVKNMDTGKNIPATVSGLGEAWVN
ncbi:MAG: flagellar basal body P-ring formation chaperone FlgA [Fibromonadales bacterium]|nr:flagellar basal body P-ring formation chaperone FlgA [Fibromonadales bacterium]